MKDIEPFLLHRFVNLNQYIGLFEGWIFLKIVGCYIIEEELNRKPDC